MAVFPDRIVLKNSTDDRGTIQAAIEAGGTDEIAQGEIVLGLETGTARIIPETLLVRLLPLVVERAEVEDVEMAVTSMLVK